MAWKKGPLPKDTFGWGGIVLVENDPPSGFYFADFCGDSVKMPSSERVVKAYEVAWYDNSLELPPKNDQ